MSGWGCVHEIGGLCQRLKERACDPGTPGCILAGRFRFSNPAKNRPHRPAPSADDSDSRGEEQPGGA